MKNIALISKTEIINKIFTLIANKLMVNLRIYSNTSITNHFDLIVVDNVLSDHNLSNLRSYSNTLVLLKDDNLEEINYDFVIEKPFLPSTLNNSLEKILKTVDDSKETKNCQTIYSSSEPTNSQISDDLANLINDMIGEFDEINQNSDADLVVKKEQLGHGGILDKDELSRLSSMINEGTNGYSSHKIKSKKDNWNELSEIIDQAIDDLPEYEYDEVKPTELILNKYSLDELSPLLKQLNKNMVDNLAEGNEIILKIRLDNDK